MERFFEYWVYSDNKSFNTWLLRFLSSALAVGLIASQVIMGVIFLLMAL